jgi:hypothetical protein
LNKFLGSIKGHPNKEKFFKNLSKAIKKFAGSLDVIIYEYKAF